MKFRYLPHTADIRMSIEAATLPLLLNAGLLGMSHILKEDHCTKPKEHDIKVETNSSASDITCLVIDFLSEALSLSYVYKAVFCELTIIEFSNQLLSTEISGSRIEGYSEEIKAVTYHEAAVRQNPEGNWETIVVFDI